MNGLLWYIMPEWVAKLVLKYTGYRLIQRGVIKRRYYWTKDWPV